ncbi:hypoxia up-regulated protein 1 isoform X2 [Orussus abietinus]|uniref:hypoxia up-regulated protein 1 isoform X2 n=1 Tax=Orussus abietinus TaxID=222816 RepID=UPI0006252B52|nr:hypoxia up-regulated protein 1 isoform X2 [Orussus abietinus]
MRPTKMSVMLWFIFAIFALPNISYGVAVMSIDIGSEWMKVAIVSPGVPMEIALNKESKRKTPVTISFRDGERTFGEDAQTVAVRSPQNSFSYILDLLGKPIDNPIVQLYKNRFPYYDIISDDERKTIAFKMNENVTFTPEELLAQILHKAKEFAENSAGQAIDEAVITVPGFFNQAERRAMMQVAELAGLKVLQLINDYSAVALNYGIFHRKEINDTSHYVMFFDMGASSTVATVVGYQNQKIKDKGFVETHPQISILGVGYDRTLGGLEIQIRLQNYLAKEFDALNKTPNSVFKNPRAMAKLFKEAGRVKNILSANADHYAQIEGLLDEKDFRLQVTREKLEELCSDVFDRVVTPVKTALEMSSLTMDIISSVVLVGAGTRMPKVQEKLSDFVKTELAKNINTDEAAALGAVYKAADLSQGFKVKKFITKDAVLFPIQIVFDKNTDGKIKQVKRTLFGRMNSYPQKKIITFNKYADFEFGVNYAELDYLPAEEITAIGNLNLSVVTVSGVDDALAKHEKEGVERKGIKAHFLMDESGILSLNNVELVFEKSSTAADEEEGSEEKAPAGKAEEQPKDEAKPVHEEPDYPGLQKEVDEKTKKRNDSKSTEEKIQQKTEKADKEKKPSVITIKEHFDVKEIKMGSQILSGDKLKESREKVEALNFHDLERSRRESALNNLESFVIDAQQKLQFDEFIAASKPEEIENILKACAEISEWLYEDGFDATADTYEAKLLELQKLTTSLYERVFEHRERPEALKTMLSKINASKTFITNMRNISTASDFFTPVEFETLEKIINETQDYYDSVVKAAEETPLYEPVKYKVQDIASKMDILVREVKYLMNKEMIWRPKQNATGSQADKSEKEMPSTGKSPEAESPAGFKTSSEADTPKESTDHSTDSIEEQSSESTETTERVLELPGSSEPSRANSETSEKDAHHEL